MNAVAVRALETMSLRADNARLLDALPDTGLSTETLLGHVDDGRHERVTVRERHTAG